MPEQYEIRNTVLTALEPIFNLFDQSIIYQEKHGYPVWKHYDKQAIINDIENGNQYEIIIDTIMAMVFSVAYTDNVIWRERDKGDSIYLHRIVVNPQVKGRKLFGIVLEWAIQHTREKGLNCVRMDTWAANPTIINYYMGFGFEFIENYTTPDSPTLPTHNRNLPLTLLEYKLT